jgi:hypothetical protein
MRAMDEFGYVRDGAARRPSVSLVGSKEEAKQQAKTLARSLGLKLYGIVDKTSTSAQYLARRLGPSWRDTRSGA